MYALRSIQLSNYLLWQDVEFEFHPGRTFLHGGNRSGKSLLVAPIEACLYDTLDLPKGAQATLSFADAKHAFEFTALNKGRTRNSFAMAVDGRDKQVETRDAAHAFQERWWSRHIQKSLFDTTISLSGLRQHPLAEGKAAQRLDWVHETLAYANVLDSYVDMVERQIKPARDNHVRYSTVQEQLKRLVPVERVRVDREALAAEQAALAERVEKLSRAIQTVEHVLELDTTAIVKPKLSEAKARAYVTRYTDHVEQLDTARDAHAAYDAQLAEYHSAEQAARDAKAAMRAAWSKVDAPKASPPKLLAFCERVIDQLSTRRDTVARDTERWDAQTDLRALRKQTPVFDETVEQLTARAARTEESLALVRRTIRSVRSGDKHCEVCGSDISAASHDLDALAKDEARWRKRKEQTAQSLAIAEARATKLVGKPKHDAAELDEALRRFKALQRAVQELVAAERTLARLTKPEPVNYDPALHKRRRRDLESAREALTEALAYAKAQTRAAGVPANLAGLSPKQLRVRLAKLTTKRRALRERQQTVAEQLVQAQTNSALYQQWRGQHDALAAQAAELETSAQDYDILLKLRKALGRDGFRTRRLQSTLELFVDNLNELAPLIWDEPFKFEIETGPRKCDVIIHRNRTRGTAFNLSGSERRSWQLIAALSMLRLLPANRRCDTIILDELEANMSVANRHRYINDFLPELQKVVPNILVVSPLTPKELGFQPDHGYMVEKKNGRSSLRTL